MMGIGGKREAFTNLNSKQKSTGSFLCFSMCFKLFVYFFHKLYDKLFLFFVELTRTL